MKLVVGLQTSLLELKWQEDRVRGAVVSLRQASDAMQAGKKTGERCVDFFEYAGVSYQLWNTHVYKEVSKAVVAGGWRVCSRLNPTRMTNWIHPEWNHAMPRHRVCVIVVHLRRFRFWW